MPRVLLITYEFPPRGGSGVQRPLKLAKYLGRFGWDVTVLTVADPPTALVDDTLLGELPHTVTVSRAWSAEPTRLVQFLRRLRSGGAQRSRDDGKAARVQGYSGAPAGLVRIVQSAFVPDEKRFWKPWAVREGVRLARAGRIDAVVTSGPPHTAHLVGFSIARKTGIPHVLDLRDPWVGYFGASYLTPLHRWLDTRAERAVITRAASVVTVTRAIADDYRDRYPGLDVRVIPNGYDPADLADRDPSPDVFTIAYTGVFGGPRTPDSFFGGLALAEAEEPDIVRDTRIVMAGAGVEVEERAVELGVRSRVRGLGYLSHAGILEVLATADAALLVLSDGPESRVSLSGKIFEYIGMRLPVLAVVGDGEAADLVSGLRGGMVADFGDPRSVCDAILRLHAQWRDGELAGPTPEEAKAYSRVSQAETWANLLDSLTGGISR